jgi:hypothetical protein
MTKVDKSAFKKTYDNLQKEIASLQERVKIESQKMVDGVFAKFLEDNPKVHGVGWTQYTPSWNDGEECYFSVNELHYYFSQDSWEDIGPHEGDDEITYYLKYAKGQELIDDTAKAKASLEEFGLDLDSVKTVNDDFNALRETIASIDDSYMEMIFGNHVKVYYTRDGFEVEEHSHD